MEISATTIYFISILDSLCRLCGIIGGLSVLSLIVLLIVFLQDEFRYDKTFHRFCLKVSVIAFFSATIVGTFIPSSNTLAAMYVIPKIAQNADVRQLPSEIVHYAREWMQQQFEDKSKKD